jgi:hypothetical protein
MKKKVSKILYFGAPGLVRPIRKESDKPPRDYPNQEYLSGLYNDCPWPKIYVDTSNPSNTKLIEDYEINDSHEWVIVFEDGTFKKYNNDIPFSKAYRTYMSK